MTPTDAEILEEIVKDFGNIFPLMLSESEMLAFARRMIDIGAAEENEECAKVCEGLAKLWGYKEPTNCCTTGTGAIGCTVAIRARRKP